MSKTVAKKTKKSKFAAALLLFLALFAAFLLVLKSGAFQSSEIIQNSAAAISASSSSPAITHISTPDPVKGVYMTSCVASSPSMREQEVNLIDKTELNTVIIDGKTYNGYIAFPTDDKLLAKNVGGPCFVKDMPAFIKELHEKGIYVVVRLATFQDPLMVSEHPEVAVTSKKSGLPWQDQNHITWIDAGSEVYWQYIAEVAKTAYAIGFDEVNFDYIRYPSDGEMSDISYPASSFLFSKGESKSDVIEKFSKYLSDNLRSAGITISADVFGQTTQQKDDMGIGQIFEKFLPYFDYVSPMIYPSLYTYNYDNLGDPNNHPYKIVKFATDSAVTRAQATTTIFETLDSTIVSTSTPILYSKPSFDIKKVRPWLQDNNYPVTYTPQMVRDQIQADYDSGLDSWMLWNAGNIYSRDALMPYPTSSSTARVL